MGSKIRVCKRCGQKFESGEPGLVAKGVMGAMAAPFTFGLSLFLPLVDFKEEYCNPCHVKNKDNRI